MNLFKTLVGVLLLPMLMSQLLAVTGIQNIPLDGKSTGRIFDGIGEEVGGGQSRLVIDYPETQRSQILDYLFLPKFGASFQTLRIEIGGDTNVAEGAEPSHARCPTKIHTCPNFILFS